MPVACSELGGNDCLIFPTQKRILVILPSVSTSSILLSGMNNGIHVKPLSDRFDVVAITPTSVNFYDVLHNNLTTLQIIPDTGAATYMTI